MEYQSPSHPASLTHQSFLKKSGLALCVLVLIVWGVSSRFTFGYNRFEKEAFRSFGVAGGRVEILWINRHYGPAWRDATPTGWVFIRRPRPPSYGFALPTMSALGSQHTKFRLPLWIPLLLLTFPTCLLWHLDARARRGLCQCCNYNLTANTSGICPECGTPIPAETKKELPSDPPKE